MARLAKASSALERPRVVGDRLKQATAETSELLKKKDTVTKYALAQFRSLCSGILGLDQPGRGKESLSEAVSQIHQVAVDAAEDGEIANALWRMVDGDDKAAIDTGKAKRRTPTVLKARSALHNHVGTAWKLSIIELFLFFGDQYAKYRFTQALLSLSKVQPDFTLALDAMSQQRALRRAGKLPPRQRASREDEWHAIDASGAMTAICPGSYLSRKEEQERKRQRGGTVQGAREVEASGYEPDRRAESAAMDQGNGKDLSVGAVSSPGGQQKETSLLAPERLQPASSHKQCCDDIGRPHPDRDETEISIEQARGREGEDPHRDISVDEDAHYDFFDGGHEHSDILDGGDAQSRFPDSTNIDEVSSWYFPAAVAQGGRPERGFLDPVAKPATLLVGGRIKSTTRTCTSPARLPSPSPSRPHEKDAPPLSMPPPPAKRARPAMDDSGMDDGTSRLPRLDHFTVDKDGGAAMLRMWYSLFSTQEDGKPPVLRIPPNNGEDTATAPRTCFAFTFQPNGAGVPEQQPPPPPSSEWALAVTHADGTGAHIYTRSEVSNLHDELQTLRDHDVLGAAEPVYKRLPRCSSIDVELDTTLSTMLAVAAIGPDLACEDDSLPVTINPLVWLHALDAVACAMTPINEALCSRPGHTMSANTTPMSPRQVSRFSCVPPLSRATSAPSSPRLGSSSRQALADDFACLQRHIQHQLSQARVIKACRDENDHIRAIVNSRLAALQRTKSLDATDPCSVQALASRLATHEQFAATLPDGDLKEQVKKEMQQMRQQLGRDKAVESALKTVKLHLDAAKTQYGELMDDMQEQTKTLVADVRSDLIAAVAALDNLQIS